MPWSYVTVIPARDPSPTLATAGIRLTSYPRHDDAPKWRQMPLELALDTVWDVDAHAFGYADLASEDDTCWRLSNESLRHPVSDSVVLTCAFVDLDRTPHEPWSSADEASEVAAELGRRFELANYTTNRGARLVAPLAQPIPLRFAQSWLRAWHTRFRETAQVADLGLSIDESCDEWSRCYRLPHVRPWRQGDTVSPGPVFSGPRSVSRGTIVSVPRGTLAEITFEAPLLAQGSISVAPSGDQPESIPDVDASWRSWVTNGSKAGPYVALLAEGRPWGAPDVAPGTRNVALKQAINSIACQVWKSDPNRPTAEDLYGIFGRSVEAEFAMDDRAPSLADLWRMASWSSDMERERRTTINQASTSEPSASSVASDGRQGTGVVFDGPELVGFGNGIGFVFDREKQAYIGPFQGSDLYFEVERHTSIRIRKGAASLRSVAELLVGSGVKASTVEICYPGVDRGGPWDAKTRTARVRTFDAPTGIEPVQHPQVAEWLDCLLADCDEDTRERALDWLATCTYLQYATCAIYFEGPPSAGKYMLSASIAQMWRTSAVTFDESIDKFNDGLVRSPVIVIDEGAKDFDRAASSRFRSYVANGDFRVQPKGLPLYTVYGNPRVIMNANNSSIVNMTGAHSAMDLRAMIERILHVPVSEKAPEYLKQLGGRSKGTPDWIFRPGGGPGKVPEFLEHLRQTRGQALIDRGEWNRFLVSGKRTDYHVKLITSDQLFGQTLIAIATALTPAQGGPGLGVVAEGSNVALVNPKALHDRWRTLITEDQFRPSLQSVSGALDALASGPPVERALRGATAAHWPIGAELILRAAIDNGLSGIDRLASVLAHGLKLEPIVDARKAIK